MPLLLGSGHAQSLGAGSKAGMLDRAKQAGLPVPPGVVIPDEAFERARRSDWVDVHRDGSIRIRDAAMLITSLKLPAFRHPVAVRPAFSVADRAELGTGPSVVRLRVDARAPSQLAQALAGVWTCAARHGGTLRRDVLIMEMVEAHHAGTALTEPDYEDDHVPYTAGPSADQPDLTLSLPKLRAWEQRLYAPDVPFAERLQHLLRDIRRVFGPDAWRVEWADDGRQCWLLQLSPLTQREQRPEAFGVTRHVSNLPEVPSPFMTSLIAACGADVLDGYRRFDEAVPTSRPFIEVIHGRPLVNVSLLSDVRRSWGLKADAPGSPEAHAIPTNSRRLWQNRRILARLIWSRLRTVRSAHRTIQTIRERTTRPGTSIPELTETLCELYPLLVTELEALTAAVRRPLALLNKTGTLPQHVAHHRTLAAAVYIDQTPLRQLAAEDPGVQEALGRGERPDHPRFEALWRAYLKRHGHRGVYELDIARPRFHEAPSSLLRSLTMAGPQPPASSDRSLTGWLTLPLWMLTARLLRTREDVQDQAMRAFDRIRQALLRRATYFTNRQVLPAPDALWLLTIEEAGRLEQGWTPKAAFFEQRKRALEAFQQHNLSAHPGPHAPTNGVPRSEPWYSRKGLSLTPGDIRGRAWIPTEPLPDAPPSLDGDPVILVARTLDAGWMPLLTQVEGVVLEADLLTSYGPSVLAELAVPAVMGIRGATHTFQTGDWLHLHADAATVERRLGL